ncbi:MAG TPA: hypothetical protein VGE34_00515 [Candidatus Saccharimonadales bacterium]
MTKRIQEQGNVSGSLIAVILLAIGLVAVAGLSIWLYVQYSDQKNNVDAKVQAAEAEAVKDTQEKDEAKFAEREKEPNADFIGPDDYGRLTFKYPKTWSVYVAKDVTRGGNFEAYLNPKTVPPVGEASQRFALRVVIQNQEYDRVIATYDGQVKKGDLKSSTVSANGVSGTRLDGSFSKDIRGAVVMFKLRDKTISVFTDADTFKPDFEKIIQTIEFNA